MYNLLITESCISDIDKENENLCTRTYLYEAPGETPEEAISNFIDNFDSNNIINETIVEDFSGACLNSTLSRIDIY